MKAIHQSITLLDDLRITSTLRVLDSSQTDTCIIRFNMSPINDEGTRIAVTFAVLIISTWAHASSGWNKSKNIADDIIHAMQ